LYSAVGRDRVALAAINTPTNVVLAGPPEALQATARQLEAPRPQAGLGRKAEDLDLVLAPGDPPKVFNEHGISIMAKRTEAAMRSDFDDAAYDVVVFRYAAASASSRLAN
jgi:hypothetical protein